MPRILPSKLDFKAFLVRHGGGSLEFLFLLFFSFSIVWPIADFISPTVFGTRDILRAYNIWHEFLPFGPEFTYGGNIPGPFFYIFSSPVLLLGGDWETLNYFKLFFVSLTPWIFWRLGRQFGGITLALLLFVFAVSSPRLTSALFRDGHQSFLSPFVALWIYANAQYFLNSKASWRWWLVVLLCLSLGMQFHFSLSMLLPVQLALHLFLRREASPIFLSKSKKWIGLAIFFAPLAPHILWIISSNAFFPAAPPFRAQIYIDMLIRFRDILAGKPIDYGNGFSLDFFTNLQSRFTTSFTVDLLAPMGVFFFFLSWFQRKKQSLTKFEKFVLLLACSVLLLNIPILGTVHQRYLTVFDTTAILFLAMTSYHALRAKSLALYLGVLFACAYVLAQLSWRDPVEISFGVAVALILVMLYRLSNGSYRRWKAPATLVGVAIMMILVQIFTKDLYAKKMEFYKTAFAYQTAPDDPKDGIGMLPMHLRPFLAAARENGLSCDELWSRVFTVQVIRELDFLEVCYALFSRDELPNPQRRNWDGVILAPRFDWYSPDNLKWKEWLFEQPLPSELTTAMKKSALRFLSPLSFGNFLAIPYQIADPYAVPEKIFNRGYAYRAAPGEEFFEGMPRTEKTNVIRKHNSISFIWNYCTYPNQKWCMAAIASTVQKEKEGWILNTRILGTSLSHQTGAYHAMLAMEWHGVKVIYSCDGRVHEALLASQVGNWPLSEATTNLYFTSPFTRLVRTGCRERPKVLKAHIDEVQIYDNVRVQRFLDVNLSD